MRRLIIAATISVLSACSSLPTADSGALEVRDAGSNQLDAGASGTDAGIAPSCFPASGQCNALAPSPTCPATELERRTSACFPNTGAWTSEVCADGGITWRYDDHGGLGPISSCSYVDGVLVGTSTLTDFQPLQVAGRWALDGCAASARCEGFDAGIFCDPDPRGRACGPLSMFTCAPTFDAERAYLCSGQLDGVIAANSCDGAATWTREVPPHFLATCVYVDGGYVGGSVDGVSDGVVAGHWAVQNCVPVGGCR